MELLQVESELEPMMRLYRERCPSRVLEIGCWDGGTLREWLLHGTPKLVVAVDLEHRNRAAYAEWRKPKTRLVLHTGESQSASATAVIAQHAPYDWVFVDGDHGEWSVTADVTNCLPHIRKGGLLLLHDIVGKDNNAYAPGQLLESLAVDYETWTYVDPEAMPWAHGIGVVQL